MNLYRDIFREATGVRDPKVLHQIEMLIRLEYRTLDHMSKEELMEEARVALEFIGKYH